MIFSLKTLCLENIKINLPRHNIIRCSLLNIIAAYSYITHDFLMN